MNMQTGGLVLTPGETAVVEDAMIELTSAVRASTTGTLYVLDEPSVGLHPVNVEGLRKTITSLAGNGNSVVVVEHEREIVRMPLLGRPGRRSPGCPRTPVLAGEIMGGVDNSHYSLVIAAAQAAGPCPPGEEAAWGRRVHGLTVDLHLIAQQARQDIERLESARTFIAFLEKVEIEGSSRRGLLTLRLPSGESEPIRTEHADTDRGRALIERARSLEGRWVLIYRYNERMAGQRNQSVRMLAHLMDLGADGAVPSTTAKKMVLQEAGGDVTRAQQAWTATDLPGTGPVSPGQLEQARAAAREAGTG